MKRYEIWDEGASETVEAEHMDEAKEQALDWLRDGSWDASEGTLWCDARVKEIPPYTDDALTDLDRAIDAFTDIFECWSIQDIESGALDSPADDVPAPPAKARGAAQALCELRKYMLAANNEAEGRVECVTLTVEPDEPGCIDDDGHDWQSPHAIVGGIEENPGCWGHGGGVIHHEVCVRCGCGKTTDTWAQRSDTGEQGLTSVSYEPDKYTDTLNVD